MAIYSKHLFVCVSGKTCPEEGSEAVFKCLKEEVAKLPSQEPAQKIRINKAGCFGLCGNGPLVVVYPEAVWYSHLKPEDCKEIVSEHLLNQRIVSKLLYQIPSDGPTLEN